MISNLCSEVIVRLNGAQIEPIARIDTGTRFELTPQVGYAIGNVGAALSRTAVVRRGRGITQAAVFSDAIRGSWVSLQLSATF